MDTYNKIFATMEAKALTPRTISVILQKLVERLLLSQVLQCVWLTRNESLGACHMDVALCSLGVGRAL